MAAAARVPSGRITPPSLVFNPPAPEAIARVARRFLIDVRTLDQPQIAERCFQSAYQAMEHNQWEIVDAERDTLKCLVNGIGQTLIMQAIAHDNHLLTNEMIRHDFAEVVDMQGETPAHYLSRLPRMDFASYYEALWVHIPRGVEERNAGGLTPLHIAASCGHVAAIDFLLGRGASVNSEASHPDLSEETRLTPIGFAVVNAHWLCVEKLLSHPDVHFRVRSNPCPTLLHLAIHHNQLDVLGNLLSQYFEKMKNDFTVENTELKTPAMLAAYQGNVEALEMLKANDVDVHAPNSKGQTLAHFAVMGGQADVIHQLYSWGVYLNAADKNGNTPKDYANKDVQETVRAARAAIEFAKMARVEARESEFISRRRPPENLVFRGGGPAGIAYAGVFAAFKELGIAQEVVRAAGASAGAIAATFVALGYLESDAGTIRDLLDVDISGWLDITPRGEELIKRIGAENLQAALNDFETSALALLRSVAAQSASRAALAITKDVVLFRFKHTCVEHITMQASNVVHEIPDGLCSGEAFRLWLDKRVEEVTDIKNCTFKEFRDYRIQNPQKKLRHLHVFATRVDGQLQVVRFTSEDITSGKEAFYDNVVISSAVRASMSIPFVFEPHILIAKSLQPDGSVKVVARPDLGIYVDGGVVMNFPLEAFDEMRYQGSSIHRPPQERRTNRRTLGFRFTNTRMDIPEPRSAVDVAKSLLSVYSQAEEIIRDERGDVDFRAVNLDRKKLSLMRFDVRPEEKDEVIADAQSQTKAFLFEMKMAEPRLVERAGLAAPAAVVLPKVAFGAAKWAKYFGDVGAEPPIPPGILQSLKTECLFWPGKRVEETHLLTLIPATVDGKPFCLDLLGELIQRPQGGGHATKYYYCSPHIIKAYGRKFPDQSYWVLLSRGVIEGTRGKYHGEQSSLLHYYKRLLGRPFEAPGLLEAATSILMEHVQTGKYLFGRDPITCTGCREFTDSCQGIVGGFGVSGLRITDGSPEHVAARFSGISPDTGLAFSCKS